MLAQSSKGIPHTLNYTAPSPFFPQTSLEDTRPWSFSVWLLPVELPQAGSPNYQK